MNTDFYTVAPCPLVASSAGILSLSKKGGGVHTIITKTCTLDPIEKTEENGWYHSTRSGTVNRIGLVNPSYKYYASIKVPQRYIISIAGNIEEMSKILEMVSTADGFEVNISCPNVKSKEGERGKELLSLYEKILVVGSLDWKRPYGLKLPPFFKIEDIQRCAEVINTLLNVRLNFTPPAYVVCCNTLANGIVDGKLGALSGPPLKPISLFNVRYFRRFLSPEIRIVGCGGIGTLEDIEEYIAEGADEVQIASKFLSKM